jgi:hypothetical protein
MLQDKKKSRRLKRKEGGKSKAMKIMLMAKST